ncbi:methyl-accepting chemotaxis protein [Trichlorobacter lovleyi]|uniref:methyl-accepting chemotaxis protein n=1 Tax=Trichlorobacter lovleyi TaxID=313985 RepID=UPI0022408612|nr:methyl-accepting chemotaxis protein [Trichlorobacter lovleyi]QOX78054.1 methyl-accepting chemotaxis protein [Trichlorobacter lovleyi]
MKNLGITAKLMVGFGLIALLLLGTLIIGIQALRDMQHKLVEVQRVYQLSHQASKVQASIYSINDRVKHMGHLENTEEKQALLQLNAKDRDIYLEALKKLEAGTLLAEGKKLVEDYKGATVSGRTMIKNLVESAMTNDRPRYLSALQDGTKLTREVTDPALKKLLEYYNDQAELAAQKAQSASRTALIFMIVCGTVAIGAALLISFLVTRTIIRPIHSCMQVADAIATGDLTVHIDAQGKDETAILMRAMGNMAQYMRETIGMLKTAATNVADAASQLQHTSTDMLAGTDTVASQALSVATAGNEMAATAGDIAQNCQMTAQSADTASSAARTGETVVQSTINAMAAITERVKSAAGTVDSLGKRSDQIGEIVSTIEDIADQTNLLALNAAIEAARAGEMGRGFAVVADEVRALAERTTAATREIGQMIKNIQEETRTAVGAMDDGVRQVERGALEAEKSGNALQDILSQITAVTGQIGQIATAAEEQTATTHEISNNMQQITATVGHATQHAKDTAAAAQHLSGLAGELQQLVARFKLAA